MSNDAVQQRTGTEKFMVIFKDQVLIIFLYHPSFPFSIKISAHILEMNYHESWRLFKWKQVNTGSGRLPWNICSQTKWLLQSQKQGEWWDLSAGSGHTCPVLLGIPLSSGWLLAVTVHSQCHYGASCLEWSASAVASETCALPRSWCLCLHEHSQASSLWSPVTGMAFKQVLTKHNSAYLCSSCVPYTRDAALSTTTLLFK